MKKPESATDSPEKIRVYVERDMLHVEKGLLPLKRNHTAEKSIAVLQICYG